MARTGRRLKWVSGAATPCGRPILRREGRMCLIGCECGREFWRSAGGLYRGGVRCGACGAAPQRAVYAAVVRAWAAGKTHQAVADEFGYASVKRVQQILAAVGVDTGVAAAEGRPAAAAKALSAWESPGGTANGTS